MSPVPIIPPAVNPPDTANPVPAKKSALTTFEEILLGVVRAAPAEVPIFVGSTKGLAIANASEILFASVLQALHGQ